MSTTSIREAGVEGGRPDQTRRVWPWLAAVVAVAVVVVVALIASGGPTYSWELNGSLEAEGDGLPARSLSGDPAGPDGFEFRPRGGLALDVDLGDSYTIEMRVRIDGQTRGESVDMPPWVKVLDFTDGRTDAGLYLFDQSKLNFFFKPETCPLGVEETVQGCRPEGGRWPLYAQADAIEVGEFATIRWVRDGDSGTVEVFVDDVLQTWSPLGGPRSYDTYSSDPSEEELEALEPADSIEDYKAQTLPVGSVLYVMTDDSSTFGSEATYGEIDYIRITNR